LLYPLSYGGQCHLTLLASGSMARHHTKDKGDLGVAKVHADLASKGFMVLFPATEHAILSPMQMESFTASR
jgi:hypothetical protein